MTFQLLKISTPFCLGRLRIFDSSIGVMRWIVGKVQEGLFCNALIYLQCMLIFLTCSIKAQMCLLSVLLCNYMFHAIPAVHHKYSQSSKTLKTAMLLFGRYVNDMFMFVL